jgi:hypothetical protein
MSKLYKHLINKNRLELYFPYDISLQNLEDLNLEEFEITFVEDIASICGVV